MTEVEKILMDRDNLTAKEAKEWLNDMRKQVEDGEDPEEVLYEAGLEPDYIYDII